MVLDPKTSGAATIVAASMVTVNGEVKDYKDSVQIIMVNVPMRSFCRIVRLNSEDRVRVSIQIKMEVSVIQMDPDVAVVILGTI
jgi:hypothetical protein